MSRFCASKPAMARFEEFRPKWACPPGATIADILAERGLTVDDFAQRVSQTTEFARELIEGRASITLAVARSLERTLGGSAQFWISRDFQYREDVARLHGSEQEWLSELPVGDMIKFGWLKPTPKPTEEVSACLGFFGVPSVAAWHEAYRGIRQMVAFRTSPTFESRPAAVAAWLRQGELEAAAVQCRLWNPATFQDVLVQIRSLTRKKEPSDFLPELQGRCAEAGVAVVVVRAPNGCKASGATRFVSPDKALLLLSFRHLSDDQFWFTFFHESGHLILHGDRAVFLEGLEPQEAREETEANDFAERLLVPPKYQGELLRLPLDGRVVMRFARKIGISPGIVVGQLQHHGKVTRRQLNNLKRRYSWE